MISRFYPKAYRNSLAIQNQLARFVWLAVSSVFFDLSPTPCFGWRRLLLRLFGATMAAGTKVYPSTRVWAPWNLVMDEGACLGRKVNCYNVAKVELGIDATASEGTFLCTASHDIHGPDFRLTTSPIRIARGAVIFAEAFLGPGVTVAEGAVVGARSVVVRNVGPYEVVAGNPSRVIGERRFRPDGENEKHVHT